MDMCVQTGQTGEPGTTRQTGDIPQENEFWTSLRHRNGWKMTPVNMEERYTIAVFDDSNETCERYANVWHIYGEWRGKVALVNTENWTVRIESISAWKVSICGGQ